MKHDPRKSLRLSRETVRALSPDELRRSAGGWKTGLPSAVTLCASCGPFCPGPITAN